MLQENWKRRAAAIMVVMVLMVACAWQAFSSSPSVTCEQCKLGEPAQRSTPDVLQRESKATSVASPGPPGPTSAAPVIERVTIDQSVACRDEPLTVEVRARGADGDNSGLITLVDGKTGNPGVISFASAGDWVVPVLVYDRARNGEVARRELNVKIRDCDARAQRLELDVREPAGDGALEFLARLPESATADEKLDRALRAASLDWDFGDGQMARAGAATSHRYRDAETAVAMRSFVVSVEANIGGRRFSAKRTVTLQSEYLANKQRGTITPEVRVGATRSTADAYSATLEIAHFEPAALHLDTAAVTFAGCETDGADVASVDGPAAQYLGTTELAPGRSKAELRLLASAVPKNACLAQLAFSGRSAAGDAVYMTAHLRLANAVPEDFRRRNTDVAQVCSLTQALALLGRELKDGAVISEEELAMLRKRGELRDEP